MDKNTEKKIWGLLEKLYIHYYSKDGFVNFLINNEIYLAPNFYENFETYSFMSSDNDKLYNTTISSLNSDKKNSILEKIISDHKIVNAKNDGWNYYGNYIREWYSEAVNLIDSNKEPTINEPLIKMKEYLFLECQMNHLFLDHLVNEINNTYNTKNYVSTTIVSRKLMECIIIRILEEFFPMKISGIYNKANHELYYNYKTSRFHEFDILLDNFESKSNDFIGDEKLVIKIVKKVRDFKNEANRAAHGIYVIPTETEIKNYNIPSTYYLLRDFYRKYCP